MSRRRRRGDLPPLPKPCNLCAPYEGRWCKGAGGGLMPCDCDRGREIYRRSPAGKREAAARARAARQQSGPKPFDPAVHGDGGDE